MGGSLSHPHSGVPLLFSEYAPSPLAPFSPCSLFLPYVPWSFSLAPCAFVRAPCDRGLLCPALISSALVCLPSPDYSNFIQTANHLGGVIFLDFPDRRSDNLAFRFGFSQLPVALLLAAIVVIPLAYRDLSLPIVSGAPADFAPRRAAFLVALSGLSVAVPGAVVGPSGASITSPISLFPSGVTERPSFHPMAGWRQDAAAPGPFARGGPPIGPAILPLRAADPCQSAGQAGRTSSWCWTNRASTGHGCGRHQGPPMYGKSFRSVGTAKQRSLLGGATGGPTCTRNTA